MKFTKKCYPYIFPNLVDRDEMLFFGFTKWFQLERYFDLFPPCMVAKCKSTGGIYVQPQKCVFPFSRPGRIKHQPWVLLTDQQVFMYHSTTKELSIHPVEVGIARIFSAQPWFFDFVEIDGKMYNVFR